MSKPSADVDAGALCSCEVPHPAQLALICGLPKKSCSTGRFLTLEPGAPWNEWGCRGSGALGRE